MLPCWSSTITLLWCEARRSLHVFTKVNPRLHVLFCHRFPFVGYIRIPRPSTITLLWCEALDFLLATTQSLLLEGLEDF
jgi:hypothetical protein